MPNSSNKTKLLAVDPSLTCSGWALFDLDLFTKNHLSEKSLLGVGKLTCLPSKFTLSERLEKLNSDIWDLYENLNLSKGDFIVCESPTSMKDPSAAIKVEQVRCEFESVARSLKIEVPGRINPRSVQYEVLGLKGKQLSREIVKDTACNIINKIFSEALQKINFPTDLISLNKNQDIVDALLIGHLSLQRFSASISTGCKYADYLESLVQKTARRNSI